MSSRVKWIVIILCAVAIAVTAFLLVLTNILSNNKLKSSIVNAPVTIKQSDTPLKVRSYMKKYNVELAKDGEKNVKSSLNNLGLNTFKSVPFLPTLKSNTISFISPTNVNVNLYDLSDLDQSTLGNSQNISLLREVYNNETIVQYFVGTLNNNEVELNLYLNLDLPDTYYGASKDLIVSNAIFKEIFLNFKDRPFEEGVSPISEYYKVNTLQSSPYHLKERGSILLNFNFAKIVHAQVTEYTCGTAQCGTTLSNLYCSISKSACLIPGSVCSSGGGVCTEYYSCSTPYTGVQCYSQLYSCDQASQYYTCWNGCPGPVQCSAVSGATPTPSPSPAPQPTAPPITAGCGVGCTQQYNCTAPGGAIPSGRAPICTINGGGYCDDCICYGNCDPAYSCTSTTWCGPGISCGAGSVCTWHNTSGGTVRSPWDGTISWSDVGGWRCDTVAACQTCSIYINPKPASVTVGSGLTFSVNVTGQTNGTVSQINFSSSNTSIATVNPSSDTSSPFNTDATGISSGTSTITATGYMGGIAKCSDTVTLTVTPPGPWWQAVGGDVISNGSVSSLIPIQCVAPTCTPYLVKDGTTGGFPGIVSYVTSYDFQNGSGTGNASSKGWLANTTVQSSSYNYTGIASLIPSSVVINTIPTGSTAGTTLTSGGTQSSDGYYWYKVTGDLTISSAATISGRKVILLVEGGNLTINGNIIVSTPGSDFFMALVGKDSGGTKGILATGTAVTEIDGLYLADNEFQTGSAAVAIKVKGSIATNQYTLQRDLGTNNTTTPAEVFEFSPAMLFAYPQSLLRANINWQEVAP